MQTEAALAVLAGRFGARVADLVCAVTNPEYDPERDRHEQYRAYVTASLDRNPWARVIKVSHFTDNGVGVIHTTGPKVVSSPSGGSRPSWTTDTSFRHCEYPYHYGDSAPGFRIVTESDLERPGRTPSASAYMWGRP